MTHKAATSLDGSRAVIHEINNLLTQIFASCELLRRRAGEDTAALADLKSIREATMRIAALLASQERTEGTDRGAKAA